jgi:hypothetical protein
MGIWRRYHLIGSDEPLLFYAPNVEVLSPKYPDGQHYTTVIGGDPAKAG